LKHAASILLLLCSCAAPRPQTAPNLNPRRLSLQSNQSEEPELIAPAATNAIVLQLMFPAWPLTNCYLMSSPDLVNWQRREFFSVTNGQTVEWQINYDPNTPNEFFMAGGETIP
jgi:hypothetical protein